MSQKITKLLHFKPMLAPNEQIDLNAIQYPIFGSYKLDGLRVLFIDGEMLSRSLKPIVNKQLRERYRPLMEMSKKKGVVLDGEFYSHSSTFQEIQSLVRTEDWQNGSNGGKVELPHDFGFYCFDVYNSGNRNRSFVDRYLFDLKNCKDKLINVVKQVMLHSKEEVDNLFRKALEENYEGLILKSPNGWYKFGRGTVKEGLMYKVKPYLTFDAKIVEVTQATKVREEAEKTVNELGYSETSKKIGDRIPIDRAACFTVDYKGKTLDVMIAMTNEEKEEVWKNRRKYIGRMIEYKAMMVGAKDVPRHAVMLRFRSDKDS